MSRLRVWQGDEDVSDEVELGPGRSNPWGWSEYPLVHKRWVGGAIVFIQIGFLYCGEPKLNEPGYRAQVDP